VTVEQRRVGEELVSEELCLGAAFCTYNFDPAYFEEQVLRIVLRLRSDPEEEAVAFHEEARRGLQQTPVAVLADARMRRPGRRLPYDLLLIRSRTFHPKLALLVYEKHARLLVGSCNLTRGGYEENVELGFVRTLKYEDPSDARTLREAATFLEACASLATPGTQLALVLDALDRRLPPADAKEPARDHRLVGSFERPILDQLLDAIPADATLTRVGVLAPYYELDDTQIGEDEGAQSFLAELVARRGAKRITVDLGVSWSDAPVAVGSTEAVSLADHLGEMWAWRHLTQADTPTHVEYLVPTALGTKQMSYRDVSGVSRRWDRGAAETAIAERRMWRVPRPSLQAAA